MADGSFINYLPNQVNTLLSTLIGGGMSLAGLSDNPPTMAPAPYMTAYEQPPPTWPYGMSNPPSLMGAQAGQYASGAAASQPPTAPNQIPMPNKPDPYLSAIAGASPILMEAMRLRAIRPTTYLSRTYNIPAAQPVTAGATVQQPARRLSPLERYQMMLAGMR